MKTGHLSASGYGLVGSAVREGKRRIIVLAIVLMAGYFAAPIPEDLAPWMSAVAAAGYVDHDAAAGTFSLSPEAALIFAAEGDPRCLQGFFQAVKSVFDDEEKSTEAIRAGRGLGWGGPAGWRGWHHGGPRVVGPRIVGPRIGGPGPRGFRGGPGPRGGGGHHGGRH